MRSQDSLKTQSNRCMTLMCNTEKWTSVLKICHGKKKQKETQIQLIFAANWNGLKGKPVTLVFKIT